MSDQTTLDVLTGMYAAEAQYLAAGGPGKASFTILAPYFADDVVLHQADALPYRGIWRGHAGLERFFTAMSAVWEVFDFLDQQFLATGSTAVVHTRIQARARATGRELRFPILQTLRLEDARIAEIRPFYWDTHAIADVTRLHPSESDERSSASGK
ncbi:nuclear transport factor 2 family protein [Nocardia cyriacigeorgica]|uniref:Nuclear transport factor 2 family protein n=1 Tax=Nocardia cyriacigeorgica TaxID=135487 RepID=A0A6P1CYQ3_9NOCA|nr:nuclear transport factor 2 family protein [Nocardia cyriacigeorgica]NEW35365.1 nuclear transport factor 2 family protein [Nocardia cyriacigeorgica]BDU09073.1 ketosteroid isomerase [Nocardia cyriacigeorgica]